MEVGPYEQRFLVAQDGDEIRMCDTLTAERVPQGWILKGVFKPRWWQILSPTVHVELRLHDSQAWALGLRWKRYKEDRAPVSNGE